MKVQKGNRVLSVDEADKAFYLSDGYDVIELSEDGKSYEVIEEATGGKTYTIAEYNALRDEKQALQDMLDEIEASQVQGFDRDAAKARLDELGVQYKGNAKNETLQQLLDEATKQEGGE